MSLPPRSSVETVLRSGTDVLKRAGVDDAVGDARKLLAVALGVAAMRLTLLMKDDIADAARTRFLGLIERRAARAPMSHITGNRAFWGRDFAVTSDVLDPRPETETLVAVALEQPFHSVLDLGTGSGAILLSLLADRPDAQGTGSDVSMAALAVARGTAFTLGVASRVTFRQSDWFAEITGRFDLIVSNPPYIAQAEMAGLAPEVRDHEPHLALTDGADGLTAYRAILGNAAPHLTRGGRLLLEIGPTQAGAVSDIAREHHWHVQAIHKDLDGRDRVVEMRHSSANLANFG